jgi:SAM-dependent methyltransferase
VLDLGCGAGDVSMLAAELVGPSGRIVGIDRAETAIALSRDRAEHDGFRNIDFQVATEADLVDDEPFDFVVGRYVVLHQPDPVSFIRTARKRLRPGGVIAFHEIDMRKAFETLPAVPRMDALGAEIMAAIKAGSPSPDVGARFVSVFAQAGAPLTGLFCERPAGGGAATPIHSWAATTLASVRSLVSPDSPPIDVDRLAAELAAETEAVQGQILGPEQCCAWARV